MANGVLTLAMQRLSRIGLQPNRFAPAPPPLREPGFGESPEIQALRRELARQRGLVPPAIQQETGGFTPAPPPLKERGFGESPEIQSLRRATSRQRGFAPSGLEELGRVSFKSEGGADIEERNIKTIADINIKTRKNIVEKKGAFETFKNIVELVPTEDIFSFREFDKKDLRSTITGEGLGKIKDSIKKKGFIEPIIIEVDKNGNATVIEGNNRLFAAMELNIFDIPVRVVRSRSVSKRNKVSRDPVKVVLKDNAFQTGVLKEKTLKSDIRPSSLGLRTSFLRSR